VTDLTAERIEAALAGRFLGVPARVYPVAVSTDALAISWAGQDQAPEGALVVADVELSARARRGPPWVSVQGASLAFSVILRPELPVEAEGLLWLLASLAAADGVRDASGLPVGLKWPNDLLLANRRLGAVKVDARLAPGRIDAAVVTVRVNVGGREPGLPEGATSLARAGVDRSRVAVLAAILKRFECWYGASVPALLDGYRTRCDTLDSWVSAHLMPSGALTGRAVDVDERGALVVETAGRRRPIPIDALRRLEPA